MMTKSSDICLMLKTSIWGDLWAQIECDESGQRRFENIQT